MLAIRNSPSGQILHQDGGDQSLSSVVGVTIPRPGLAVRQFFGANCRPLLALPVTFGALLQSIQELSLFVRSTPFAELVMPRYVLAKEIEATRTSSVVGVGLVEPLVFPSRLSLGNNGKSDSYG
ncbi:MAG: hypothetical protein ABSC05_38770, partial [Candidatus Solibacter sp.]